MSWICKTCGREFKNTNQFHSCEQSTIEQHLYNKPEFIVEIFHTLLNILSEIGKYQLLPLKTVIQAQRSSTFLSIYLKRNKVHLEFQSAEEYKSALIKKTNRISKTRLFHYAEIKSVNEMDNIVVSMITEAYNLSP